MLRLGYARTMTSSSLPYISLTTRPSSIQCLDTCFNYGSSALKRVLPFHYYGNQAFPILPTFAELAIHQGTCSSKRICCVLKFLKMLELDYLQTVEQDIKLSHQLPSQLQAYICGNDKAKIAKVPRAMHGLTQSDMHAGQFLAFSAESML